AAGRRFRRLTLTIEAAGDGATADDAAVVRLSPAAPPRDFEDQVAFHFVRDRLGRELWVAGGGSVQIATTTHALRFLQVGLGRHLATEALSRERSHLFATPR